MYHGFNGDFRRKPEVSIRGASKKETKEQLLERAKQERTKREAQRMEKVCAIRIQSLVRRFLSVRRSQSKFRMECDQIQSSCFGVNQSPDSRSLNDLSLYLERLFFVLSLPADLARLRVACTWTLERKSEILTELQNADSKWKFKIARLLSSCVKFFLTAKKEDNINAGLRLFETMTDSKAVTRKTLTYIYSYLFPRKYFASVRHLTDTRIPPLMEEYTRPPVPAAQTFLEMILKPFDLFSDSPTSFRKATTMRLSENFFTSEFSEQVKFYIIPALAENNFPMMDWVMAMDKEEIKPTKWFLFSFLRLGRSSLENMSEVELKKYLSVLSHLTFPLVDSHLNESAIGGDEDDEDEDERLTRLSSLSSAKDPITEEVIVILNDSRIVGPLIAGIEKSEDSGVLKSLCGLCHNLLLSNRPGLLKYSLLNALAFRASLLRRFWNLVIETKQSSSLGTPVPLLTLLSKGIKMTRTEQEKIVPPLAVFASIFGYLLITVHDSEFFGDGLPNNNNSNNNNAKSPSSLFMPFSLDELVPMSLLLRDVSLGLVELAYPESRPTVREDYQQAVRSVRNETMQSEDLDTKIWSHLFKKIVDLLRHLYTRDTRRQFCPDDHWICDISLPVDKNNGMTVRRSRIRLYRPFQSLRVFTRELMDEEGPPLTTKEVRLATILREMPYAISFSQRVNVFLNLLSRDKSENQGDLVAFGQGQSISLSIRRNYIYEDAFEKLSPENEPNVRLKMRVQLRNAAGLDEAGIDGGGLFREFMTQLLRTAFDPNRGFFQLTTDQQLYPNPLVRHIEPDFQKHYFFIGRMLGKILYESHLVELPLASFFISKLFGLSSALTADIDYLSSLDPELYKNLLYLKTYTGDVKDLNLDFTIVNDELGKRSVEELKPGGADIPVTKENRIEYIHLIADYKLNKQIKAQCHAFRQGLSDIINLDWLRMFSCRELQTLISGAETEINIDDLKQHTKYGNGFSPDHKTIVMFWRVVTNMGEKSKRSLLKFVSSCSRPPLLGFKELDPPFCIQNVGEEEDRLPTASTCMNLLKLPAFKDEGTLREKLIYAIESGAGFELS